MRNRFPGICYRCGEIVDVGAGHFEKRKGPWGKWRTQHAECAILYRGQPCATATMRRPTMSEAQAAKPVEVI